jgi:hypothetical protein
MTLTVGVLQGWFPQTLNCYERKTVRNLLYNWKLVFYLFINKINLYVWVFVSLWVVVFFYLRTNKNPFHCPLFANASLLMGRHKLISTESLFSTMTPSSLPGFASRMRCAKIPFRSLFRWWTTVCDVMHTAFCLVFTRFVTMWRRGGKRYKWCEMSHSLVVTTRI